MPRSSVKIPKVLAEFQLSGRAVQLVDSAGRIDLDNLSEEVQEADAIALHWGILAAKADREAADADITVDVTLAETRRHVRAEADGRGLKLTVDAINDAATLDLTYQATLRTRAEAQERASMMQAMKFSTIRKAERLTRLTHLLGQELWAQSQGRGR